jgi:uncharacterized alpha-E superfamily protein
MIDVHYHFGLESPVVGDALRWSSILAISGQEKGFEARHPEADEEAILEFFAFDRDNPGSILSCLREARENARTIRDQLSSEMWECLNRLYLEVQQWDVHRVLLAGPFAFFHLVKDGSHLFQGITNRTLMMGEARDFHDTGRFLERGDQTARILDVKYHDLLPAFVDSPPASGGRTVAADVVSVGGPVDVHGWVAVLKSVGAFEAFSKTYRRGVSPARVAEFLILNPQFPASVRHSVGRVDTCLRRISGNRDLAPKNDAERTVGRLYNELNYMRAEEIIAAGLHEFLQDVQVRFSEVGDAIFETYLRY